MDKDLLKDVFLHGVSHADMARLIDSKDIVSSYDNASVYDYVMKCEKYERRYDGQLIRRMTIAD